MNAKLFNMQNKMIISTATGGATNDSFYSGPAPDSALTAVNKSIAPLVAATLYLTLTDHGYYNTISIIINLKNSGSAVNKSVLFDYWESEGTGHIKAVTCAFDEVISFTATYGGLSGTVADLKIQAKDSSGEIIDIPGDDTTTYSYYPCYFQEATAKHDLIEFGVAGIAVDNLYYCRAYREMDTLDWFQVEGFTKEVDSEIVNQDFLVYSLVRKIRIPGSSKVIAYDFFAKAGTKP